MSSLTQDFRQAVRALLRAPGFASVAILTLALGIGANTAVFSVVDAVLLRPLPFSRPDRLVAVRSDKPSEGWEGATSSPPNYFDMRSRNHVFTDMTAYDRTRLALTGDGPAQRLDAAEVSAGFFGVLGVRPEIGRTFVPADERLGAPNVVVLSHRLFMDRFGGSADILSRVVELDGMPTTVVGVMPAGFEYPRGASEAWVPLRFPANVASQRGAHYLSVVARLRADITVRRADREMKEIAAQLEAQYPDKDKGWTASVKPLHEQLVGSVRPALWILLGAVCLLTLIACANVANLLLARAAGRKAEIAVRTALGARPARLMRQLLTESLVLAIAGAGLGVLLAGLGVPLLLALGPKSVPMLEHVSIDGPVLAFTAGLAVVTALLFGMLPAWRVLRFPGIARGSELRTTTASREESRLRGVFVGAEIALALMLLTGSGLLIRSFANLQAVGPGFEPRGILKLVLDLPHASYPNKEGIGLFDQELLGRIRSIPGVDSAAATFQLPLTDEDFSSSFKVEGHPVPEQDEPSAQLRIASRDYFRVMRIPLVRGRLFDASDAFGKPPVVLATETAVRRHWPRGDAIGQVVHFGASPGAGALGGRIVGIVGDIRDDALNEAPAPEFYVSLDQSPVDSFSVVIRTTGPPNHVASAVRAAISGLDRELPVADLESFESVLDRSVSQPRFYATLLSSFGALALLLASVGVYGVISYGVAQRRRELALRIALGAGRSDIRGLVVGQAARLTGAGIAAGVLGSFALTRLLEKLLFGVHAIDLPSFGAAAVLLALVAMAAGELPARRASRVDPADALRAE